MILHHIQTSPNNDSALECCLNYISTDDSILLSSDAVIAIMDKRWQMELAKYNLMLLKNDVIARGLQNYCTKLCPQCQCIEYAEFVTQTLTHQKVISW